LSLPGISPPVRAVCFDWGGTLMVDDGPEGVPMYQWDAVTVVPGASACLAALDGLVPLCIATNAGQSDRTMIERALERVDLLRYIGRIFCYTEIGCTKDRPEFWRAVANDLGLSPAEIVMVGDAYEHDVEAPRRAGVQAVWFNEGGRQPAPVPAVPTVTDLVQLVGMIRRLETGEERS
jgi:FMN phosphatase YigB (HAD superfamily)